MIISIAFDLSNADCNKGNLLLKEMEENRQKFETVPQRFRRANPRVTRSVFAVLWIINMLFLIPIPKFFFEDDSKEKYHIPWNKFETIPKGKLSTSTQVLFFIYR